VHVCVGESGGRAGSEGGGQQRAGFRTQDAAALGGGRGQQRRVVLAQQGAQFVVRAGALSHLPSHPDLPQAVAAADGRLGRPSTPPRSRPAPCSGWGGRLRVTDLAAQLGATGRHRSSAQTPDRWTVVAKMLPQR